VDLVRICELAHSRLACHCPLEESRREECRHVHHRSPLRVAVACDDVFGGYFPDTLELLESRGAAICDFSPLRDDRLPAGTDVVYVGCGHPEQFAGQLSANDCMMLALKSHLCSGGRIYAECGGLAYLCNEIEMPDGQRWPMVGALGVTARFHESIAPPHPAELTLVCDTWLGQSPQHWRGYLTPHWTIAPTGDSDSCVAEAGHELDVIHRHQAVGSRMYLNFAAHEDLLDRFFEPHARRAVASLAANPGHGLGL
jgi:cobyrinic acid a,c-diamide synthase